MLRCESSEWAFTIEGERFANSDFFAPTWRGSDEILRLTLFWIASPMTIKTWAAIFHVAKMLAYLGRRRWVVLFACIEISLHTLRCLLRLDYRV